VKKIVDTTLNQKPPGETHWSTRTLAEKLGTSHMTVQRVWKAHNLQPHRTRSFKLSKDPEFEEKLVDVVGLYMNPPEKAVVFSFDEKPQMQAPRKKSESASHSTKFPRRASVRLQEEWYRRPVHRSKHTGRNSRDPVSQQAQTPRIPLLPALAR